MPHKLGAPLAEKFMAYVKANETSMKRENVSFILEADGDQLVFTQFTWVATKVQQKFLPIIPDELAEAFTETTNLVELGL